jgi:DNA replication factor GINS
MNLDEIRSVLDDERRTDRPQPLPDDFYADVADYLADLRDERAAEAAAADDPWNADPVNRLTHRINTAENAVESLCDRRVGKILNQASLAANGSATDPSGLTSEERAFFDSVVTTIAGHHEAVLGPVRSSNRDSPESIPDLDAGADAPSAAAAASDGPPSGPTGGDGDADPDRPVPPDVAGGDPGGDGTASGGADAGAEGASAPADAGDDAASTPANADDTERVRVRITRDVGEILGVDEREYHLEADDVLTLPEANAEPLVDRGAAERIS